MSNVFKCLCALQSMPQKTVGLRQPKLLAEGRYWISKHKIIYWACSKQSIHHVSWKYTETLKRMWIYPAPAYVYDLSLCFCLTCVTPPPGVQGLKFPMSTVKLCHPQGHRGEPTFHTQILTHEVSRLWSIAVWHQCLLYIPHCKQNTMNIHCVHCTKYMVMLIHVAYMIFKYRYGQVHSLKLKSYCRHGGHKHVMCSWMWII